MSNPVVRQIVLASRPNGPPKADDFRLEKLPMPKLPPGGLLLRVLYLSLDPYMRGRMDDVKSYAKSVGIGEVMTGESVCEVLASDRADFAAGDNRAGAHRLAHACGMGWTGNTKTRPEAGAHHHRVRRPWHAGLHRLCGPILDRQAEAR